MAREKAPKPDTAGDIPPWFMTYSDVITLLMTFFILLLTFASQEPEEFERMKVTMFGAGGSDGNVGSKSDSVDRESVTLRYRPEKSRLTQHGSETSPANADAPTDGVSEGLKALEEESRLAALERVTFSAARNLMVAEDGKQTVNAKIQIASMAKQMLRFNMKLSINAPSSNDLPAAIQMAYDMTYQHGVPLGQVSVGTQAVSDDNAFRFTITRGNKS